MERPRAAERIERLPFTQWQWGIIILAVAAWLVEAIDIGLSGATLPSLKAQFHLSPKQIGAFATAATSGIVLALVFAGILIDQFGKRKVLLTGMLIFGLGTVAVAFAPSIDVVILVRFLTGLGLGVVFPIPYQFVVELVPARIRGFSVGAIGAVLFLGYFTNLLVGSFIIPHFGWRPMYVFGGISLIALIFVWFYLPESPRWLEVKGRYNEANRILERIERTVERYFGQPLPTIREDLPCIESPRTVPVAQIFQGELLRRTLMVWTMAACLWSGFYFFSVYLPEMGRMQGYPLQAALLTAAAVNAAPIPTHLLGAWLLEQGGRRLTIGLFGLLGLIGIAIFALSRSYVGGLLSASLAFGFIAAASSFTKLLAAEAYPTRLRGTGTTWTEAVGRGVAGIVIPFLLAQILATGGVPAASAVVLGVSLIGLVVFLVLARESRGAALENLDPHIAAPRGVVAGGAPNPLGRI